MRYRTIANTKLVLFTFICSVWCCFLPILMVLFSSIENLFWNLGILLILFTCVWGICALIYRDAFILVEMNNVCLKTKKGEIKWEEIDHIEIKETKLLQFSLFPTIHVSSVVCYSKKVDGGTGTIIEFSLKPNNLKYLGFFGETKSKAVFNFLKNEIV